MTKRRTRGEASPAALRRWTCWRTGRVRFDRVKGSCEV